MMHRVTALLVAAASAPLAAQWLQYHDPAIPRLKNGQPNLSAPAPRLADGKPDLSGVWAAEPSDEMKKSRDPNDPLNAELQYISKYALNILGDVKTADEPLRPEAAALLKQRQDNAGKDIPTSHCLPGGVPFSTLIAPFKIVHTPRLLAMLLEDNNPPRQIHIDGRPPVADPWPAWMGYSAATWDKDTLVVDTRGFNERSWLDALGHPRSDAMRIVERFHRRDVGHMDLALTVDDSKMYTKSFTINVAYRLLPDTDILESICAENEKDRNHLDR
jgi:hypothetical protein